MWGDLPEGARRVQQFLFEHGSAAVVRLLPETTATAQDAATALGVPISQIGKSIVFASAGATILAIACGDQRIDVDALARAADVNEVKSMRPRDVKQSTSYVIGGVSPFGLPLGVKIILDLRLRSLPECYVAAGHPRAVVQTTPDELITITGAVVAPIAEEIQPEHPSN
jgi:prolyl-tRNA editing enzyme YbaK/EbsC (Cys-tRNA(Pro) deacylase)